MLYRYLKILISDPSPESCRTIGTVYLSALGEQIIALVKQKQ